LILFTLEVRSLILGCSPGPNSYWGRGRALHCIPNPNTIGLGDAAPIPNTVINILSKKKIKIKQLAIVNNSTGIFIQIALEF
jgi:hypothetical protein|tara:strand:+ start:192700 stop:192945 length:246 start_codon:yes stop_codon:yes gene_type:complete